MSHANDDGIQLGQVQAFLADHLNIAPEAVTLVGAGAWSRCFGFQHRDRDLVIRFSKYKDDFQNDRRAYAYAAPALPIPEVLEIGQAFDGYYAISTRVYGLPLEQLDEMSWRATVPAVVSTLEALRLADISATVGAGGWDSAGKAPFPGWSGHLLAVDRDTPDRRTYGWRPRLATMPTESALFAQGYALLEKIACDATPRCLIHSDLLNRNVFVAKNQITGVLDWGCSLYGDHLYDLAWFEFWGSWFPRLNMRLLRTELEQHWREVGYVPENKEERLLACYLHIGLDHLAYNAYLADWPAVSATAERIKTLVQRL